MSSIKREEVQAMAIAGMVDASAAMLEILGKVRGSRHLNDADFLALVENAHAVGRGVRAVTARVNGGVAGARLLDDVGDELR